MRPAPFFILVAIQREAVVYDIIGLLEEYNIDYKQEVKDWVNVECPICQHHGTRGYKGGFNIGQGYYHCWNCGGHDIIFAVSKLLNISYSDAGTILSRFETRYLPHSSKATIGRPSSIELIGSELSVYHRRYLRKRRFDPDYIIGKYMVRGTGLVGKWCMRIIIPIMYNGRIVSYQGRDITGRAQNRYLTLSREKSIIDPKTILYNSDNCTGESAVVVEGVFDAWRLGDGAIATLGTTVTDEQVKWLRDRRFRSIYILFDPEGKAQARAIKLAKRLGTICNRMTCIDVIDMEWEHDPGDLTDDEVLQVRKVTGI